MIRPIKMPFAMPLMTHFWASPQNTMSAIAKWGSVLSERNAFSLKAIDSGFPRDDPPETPPRKLPDFPTDVPAPEPHDVPVPEPIDPPVPDPGKAPVPTKPSKAPGTEPKPRSVP